MISWILLQQPQIWPDAFITALLTISTCIILIIWRLQNHLQIWSDHIMMSVQRLYFASRSPIDIAAVDRDNALKKCSHKPSVHAYHATKLCCEDIASLTANNVKTMKICSFIVYATKYFPEKQQKMSACVNKIIQGIYFCSVDRMCPNMNHLHTWRFYLCTLWFKAGPTVYIILSYLSSR